MENSFEDVRRITSGQIYFFCNFGPHLPAKVGGEDPAWKANGIELKEEDGSASIRIDSYSLNSKMTKIYVFSLGDTFKC